MQLLRPPAKLLPFGLRAVKMIATANGVFDENERGLLNTAQEIFGSHHDLDALEPIDPLDASLYMLTRRKSSPSCIQTSRCRCSSRLVPTSTEPGISTREEALAHAVTRRSSTDQKNRT